MGRIAVQEMRPSVGHPPCGYPVETCGSPRKNEGTLCKTETGVRSDWPTGGPHRLNKTGRRARRPDDQHGCRAVDPERPRRVPRRRPRTTTRGPPSPRPRRGSPKLAVKVGDRKRQPIVPRGIEKRAIPASPTPQLRRGWRDAPSGRILDHRTRATGVPRGTIDNWSLRPAEELNGRIATGKAELLNDPKVALVECTRGPGPE